ncbi:hypothetical protein KR50_28480 [Jeotgalibacillus campisalis]|uniref:Uncharacterized protein n=1 Tax=Jeotgalibacillus campisalis TaxID=220754 RepID=A0A0C2RWN9_9BACL|nr:hypothetical protein KR50_28480 [Jeotgalibacillus campisalis]
MVVLTAIPPLKCKKGAQSKDCLSHKVFALSSFWFSDRII